MSDDDSFNVSGIRPSIFHEPNSLSSKRDRERQKAQYFPQAPKPHQVRSAPCHTRIIHSRNMDTSDLDSSFNMLMAHSSTPHHTGQNGGPGAGGAGMTFFRQFFEIQERLGSGSFGDVFRVRSTIDGLEYAIKKSKRTYSGEIDRARQLREVQRVVNIPYSSQLVQLERAWEEENYLYLQMELCAKSLNQRIEEGEPLSEGETWDVLIDMLLAVSHLHQHRLVHLDIKPDNIFLGLDSPILYKLGDFGIIICLDENRDINDFTEGDSRYLAPEVMQGICTTKADVFSLGLVILEIACHVDLPKSGKLWQDLRSGGPLPDPCDKLLPQSLQEVIKQMLIPDPTKRPEIDDLFKIIDVKREYERRRWILAIAYMKRKLLALKRLWNTVLCFLASLLVVGKTTSNPESPITQPSPAKITPTDFPTSPHSTSFVVPVLPEICVRSDENEFSDDDDEFFRSKKSTPPAFASTPVSSTASSKFRSSARLRGIGSTSKFGTPASRNLLKDFEACSDTDS